MCAAGICSCFAGIAPVPKNVAQASPCLLQAPAFVLQASRSYGKIGRRHLTPFGVLKKLKEGRCRGEAVANATAVRIEGSIVCKTCFQTGYYWQARQQANFKANKLATCGSNTILYHFGPKACNDAVQPVVSNATSTDKSREALMLQNTRSPEPRTTTCHVQRICDGTHADYLQYWQPSEIFAHNTKVLWGIRKCA